jgi:ubiquinone/menaquinone biosynthesis C-methylase UbiE
MISSQAYWNRTAARYAAQPVADQAAYEEKLRRTRALLRPDMDMLEFGCGTGTTALLHAPLVRSVLAIDYADSMVDIARAKADAAGIGTVTFKTEAIETLAAADESFDIVLGMSILHLVPDRDAALARVFSLLKPGGFFVSSTACLGGWPAVAKWLLPVLARFRLVPDVGFFTADDLVRALETAGFAVRDRWQPKPGAAVFIIAEKP